MGQDQKGRHLGGVLTHQQYGCIFHGQTDPREEIYQIQRPHHGNDPETRNRKNTGGRKMKCAIARESFNFDQTDGSFESEKSKTTGVCWKS